MLAIAMTELPHVESPNRAPTWVPSALQFAAEVPGALHFVAPGPVEAKLRAIGEDFADLAEDWVLGYRVFRDRFAQAICTTNFAQRIPPIQSGIGGLLLTDSTQLYPSDRTISGMFGQARRVAALIPAVL